MIPLAYYLILSGILFALGVAGFIMKSDLISVFISIELMLNAVNLSLIAFSHYLHDITGNLFVFFVMVVAAAEAAVGLAIIIAVVRNRQTLSLDAMDLMKH